MRIFFLLSFFFFSLFASTKFQDKYLTDEQKLFLKEHPIIKVSNERNWPPYDFYEDNEAKGYAIDYIKMIAKKIGVQVVFETDNWNNLLEKVKNKEIDLIHPLTINESRKKFLHFTRDFIQNRKVLVTQNSNKDIKTIEDLKGKSIALGKGWGTTKLIKQKYKDIKIIEVNSSKEMMEAVAFGKVDATIDNYLTVNYIKQKYLLNNLNVTNRVYLPSLDKNGLRMAVRKDWKPLADILEIAIKNVTNEEIIELNRKWDDVKNKKILLTEVEQKFLKNDPTIKIRVSEDYYPFSFIKDDKAQGYVIDYTNFIAKKLNLNIEYIKGQTWGEAIDDFKNGKLDVLPMMNINEERKKYARFTSAIIETYVGIATLKENLSTVNIDSLKNKKVAIMKGYWFIKNLKEQYPNINTVVYKNNLECLVALKKGEVDAVISTEPVLQYLIKENYFVNIGVKPISNNPYFQKTLGRYAVRKDLDVLKDILQKGMDSLTLDEILELKTNWFGNSLSNRYEKPIDYDLILKIVLVVIIVLILFAYRQYLLKKENLKLLRTQKQLEDSVFEFESLINSTLEAIFIFEEKKCIKANTEAIKLFDYEKEKEILGINLYDLIDKEKSKNSKNTLDEIGVHESFGLKKSKESFPILLKAEDFVFRGKNVRLVAIMDLTELKHKEKLLTEHTKMVALGEMLGNIAHQWRQPLSVISTAASGIKIQKEMDILSDEVFNNSLDGILSNTKYLSNTIDDFRNFIINNKSKIEFDLEKHMESVLPILKPMLEMNKIKIIQDYEKGLRINSITNEVSHVIINIITNSKDKFLEESIEERYIFIKTVTKDNNACIFIKDNAGGIPEDIIDKIFEPYFTTKHKDQGTGLGLYMTREIVTKGLNGVIEVNNVTYEYNNKNYKGAEFTICLDK